MKVMRRYFTLIVGFATLTTYLLTSLYIREDESLPLDSAWWKEELLLSQLNMQQQLLFDDNLTVPEIRHMLPHLFNNATNPNPFIPSLRVSQNRRNATVVIGIPSVKRNHTDYLLNTLKSLLLGMEDEEKHHVLIVIFLGDFDATTVAARHEKLKAIFAFEIASGLIDIVAPSPSFYPDFDSLRATLDDAPNRMKWRTKQTLDYAYLMMYAANRGRYYLQLEDDVLATSRFMAKIFDSTMRQEKLYPDWIYIQYAENGYIGKLFHNRDLMSYTVFFVLFHAAKPVDWLLRQYVTVRVCSYADPWVAVRDCKEQFQKAVSTHRPSLFQHVGLVSSLDGKSQPLKEKNFVAGVVPKYATPNPHGTLGTTLRHYDKNTLNALYEGTGIFWAYPPVKGDYIQVNMTPPIVLRGFLVLSGISAAPADLLEMATFEVKPETAPASLTPNSTFPGFFVLASFDERGGVNGSIPSSFGKISTVRINIFNNHTNWVAINALQLQP